MNQRQRTALVGGFLLILFGACLLAVRLAPGWQDILPLVFRWPVILLGVGLLLFVLGLLTGEAGMAVPACIVSGIGLVLYSIRSQPAIGGPGCISGRRSRWLGQERCRPASGNEPCDIDPQWVVDHARQPGALPGLLIAVRRARPRQPVLACVADRARVG